MYALPNGVKHSVSRKQLRNIDVTGDHLMTKLTKAGKWW
jgi:hypothetical protein